MFEKNNDVRIGNIYIYLYIRIHPTMSPYSGWFDPIKVGTNIAKLLCVTGLSFYNIYIYPLYFGGCYTRMSHIRPHVS